MSSRKKASENESPVEQNIKSVSITNEMEKSYLDYAMSVIVARALPDARDGLKPVQRRIIYAMHEQGIQASSRYVKCAAVVGEVLKKYHPHGDLAVYDALVRMAQDFSLRYPLVDGQGNFGSIDGDSPAAMRYTECRLAKISEEVLTDIDKETVDFIPNYSGDHYEPVLLPTVLPVLLLNGASGIAVGMATNIPPHNLSEVVAALLHMIANPEKEVLEKASGGAEMDGWALPPEFESTTNIEELTTFIKGPDFPTGGKIFNHQDILQSYVTGKGGIVMRGVATIEEVKEDRFHIIITELPYQVNKALLVAKIAQLVKDKKIEGISDLRDESDRHGLRVVVEMKKDARPQQVLNLLFKHTELQKSFNTNFVALVDNEPRTMTLKMILEEFVRHRQRVIFRRALYLLKRAKEREHILQGLKIALDHLDEVIKTIRESADSDVARTNLMSKFGLTEIQATAILDMQLRRLAALERQKIEDELAEIIKTIASLEEVLASPVKILEKVKEGLLAVKEKYGDARRTKVYKQGVGEWSDEELIKEERVIISITKSGYIKRLPSTTYHTQGRGGKGVTGSNLKEEDELSQLLSCSTHDDLYFFTNRGKIYTLKAWDVPEASRTAKGTAIINLINLEAGETIATLLTLSKETGAKYLIMATKEGTVKKTPLSEFENIRRNGILAIKISSQDELEWVKPTTGENEVILTTASGKAIRFKESDTRPMGRGAGGVRGIRLGVGDSVVGMDLIEKDSKADLLVITEGGLGKKTKLSEYRLQNRGGSGIITAKITAKKGGLVAAKVVDNQSGDILLTSALGQVIRLPAKDISRHGRSTQGVTLMRLKAGDSVAAMTVFEIADEEVEKE